jgi:c-di-GMP phosphodiesterase
MSEPQAPSVTALGQFLLSHSPVIDSKRQVVATRLTVFPAAPGATPDAAALLQALYGVWPAPAPSEVLDDTSAAQETGEEPLNLTLRQVDEATAAAAAAANAKAMRLNKTSAQRGAASAAGMQPSASQTLSADALRAAGMSVPSTLAVTAKPQARQPAFTAVALNIADEALLRAVLLAAPAPHLMIEVPAFLAADASLTASLRALQANGTLLLIKGRPLQNLAPEVLACFTHAVVQADDERRGLPSVQPGQRAISNLQSGVRTTAAANQAFERGALAVVGWPMDDAMPASNGRAKVPSDVQVVMELINGVDRELPVPRLEALLKRDPTVAFRLMRYLNSAAFGMTVEINSFSHALMLLGYQRLKRWLALLLASSCRGINMQPLMHAAVHRGLLMEELARSQGDAEVRSEMFICGIFSLLDKLLQQPFSEMLSSIPVPERVQQALLGEGGPYGAYLDLVRAIEDESVYDIRENAAALMLSPAEVNQALLRALLAGKKLDD